jgi:hypothetical protein
MRWLAVLLLASAATASAQPVEEWDFGRNGLFPEEPPFAHAEVAGQGRLRFLEDMDGCPDKGAACPARGYVIPGDKVLTSKVHGAYTCAFYPSRGGGTAGWVETARLRPLPVEPAPRAEAWIGQWSSEGNPVVTIRRSGEELGIDGEAYWPSPNPPVEERPGGPNIGSIGGAFRVTGSRAEYDEGDGCQVSFTLVGDLLIAGDNHRCGGMNVSFSGVYKRTSRRPG